MSAGAPFIGSKINLISKAEIRYQGTLYQVDTKEATVTLAKVRSFGTENRQVPKPIPPRNEVYEFIIFRASDIKDLNVISQGAEPETPAPAPQDPAIVSATQAPQQTMAPPTQPSAPSHPRPPTYTPFPPPNMYSPFGMPYVRPPVMMGTRGAQHPPPMHPPHPVHPVPIHQQTPQEGAQLSQQNQLPRAPGMSLPAPVQPLVGTVQTTNTLASIIGNPGVSLPDSMAPAAPSNIETEPQASSTPMVTGITQAETTPKASLPLESESPGVVARAQPSIPVGNQQVQPPPSSAEAETSLEHQPQVDSTTHQEEETGNKGGDRRRDNARRGRYQNRQYEGRGGYRGQNRRGFRGNYRGPPRGGYRSQQQRPNRGGGGNSNGPVYRYESEFDFESANARFKKEAFEEEFKQLHVDDRSEGQSRQVSETNGEVEPPPDDRTEVGVATSEAHSDNEADSNDDEFYDKSKSFFDSISCENNGPNRRADRNAERELNTETFGVSNYRGYNHYRGRGRGRGRGSYGNRGGYRSNRGGGGGYRQNRGYSDKNRGSRAVKQD